MKDYLNAKDRAYAEARKAKPPTRKGKPLSNGRKWKLSKIALERWAKAIAESELTGNCVTRGFKLIDKKMAKILEIARASRKWTLSNRAKFSCGEDLAGMCAIASGHLHNALQSAGISAKLAINDEHVFVIADGHIVDITATQYGKAPVCIVDIEQADGDLWYIAEEFDTVAELRKSQIGMEWPVDQLVYIDE